MRSFTAICCIIIISLFLNFVVNVTPIPLLSVYFVLFWVFPFVKLVYVFIYKIFVRLILVCGMCFILYKLGKQ